MKNNQIVKYLEQVWDKCDSIQEEDVCQNNEGLLWEIGEIMGHIDNAIDILNSFD